MPTIRDLLHAARSDTNPDARHEAEILLAHALDRSRTWLIAHASDELDTEVCARYERLVAARARGEPVAYLTGTRGFWTLDLAVGPAVLIPRPETELLVELALERIPHGQAFQLADMGTGSGAIALAIASERPQVRVLATDQSEPALEVARRNAQSLSVSNVEFAQGDWCAAFGTRQFDMIVSNPPYIAANDRHLAEGDLRFEPPSALSSGADGLDAIRQIIAGAPSHLASGGWLLLEHGYDQGEAVRKLLASSGFVEPETWQDIGGNDRISGARLA
jgi:release factor glutamine methyltransferase